MGICLMFKDGLVTIASVNFYRSFFQCDPAVFMGDRYARFDLSSHFQLGIFRPHVSHEREFDRSPGSGMSICLEVIDLAQAIDLLTNLGYPPPGSIISASHGKEIYAYDPDGNRLILHQGP
jgi:hypothetical protein